jgi:hypothetical protein
MRAKKILILACLLIIGGQAFSQNGTNPYVNSTHTYSVTDAGGSLVWSVLMANGDAASVDTDYTMTGGTTASANITWLKVNDADAPISNANYIVQLEETAAVASGGCSTMRQFVVTVIGNTFDITIADLAATCSDASGNIIVDETNSNLGTTSKTFTIDMIGAAFNPDWKFDYEVTSTNGDLQTVTFDENTAVPSPVVGANTATGIVTVNNNDASVQLTVVFNNTWANGDVITVKLSNGIELTYNTPASNKTDEGAIIINAMPATTKILTD